MRKQMMALMVVSLFAFALAGCKKEKAADTKEVPKTTEPKKGTEKPAAAAGEKGNTKVLAAFKNVLDNCEVGEWGYIRRKTCKDRDAEKNLRKQEKMVGLKESLMTYCYKLADKNHLARALASYRISTMNYARRMSEAADAEVFKCLLPHFTEARKRQHVRRLAKAITFMGTALKKDDEVIKAIDGHREGTAKQAGYEALWANGRLRVFPKLEEAIKGSDSKLAASAIKSFGFGERPNDAEKAKVCGLLIPYMLNDNLNLAASAAYRVASVCKDKKSEVIKAGLAMIKKNKFNMTYISALRTTAGWFTNKADKGQRKEIIGVLKKVLKNSTVSPLTRSTALGAIYHVDKKEGKKVAKQYKGDKERFVAKEAERILKK
ncbi:MAG: hypothetical protein JRH20_12485 [Deltaproteobacteria bacterium]|nr:hypothetical protein [Deltaproteobacteria bacterium]